MKAGLFVLSWVVAAAPTGAWAASPPGIPANQQLRLDVRDALEAQRVAGQAAERREEAAAGRRLTEAERARLREQLRREWAAYTEAEAAAPARPFASGAVPAQAAGATATTAGELRQTEPGTGAHGVSH